MSAASIATAAYLVAALLFILSLAGLSRHESAKQGWTFGVAGMVIALAATISLTIHDSSARGTTVLILVVAIVIGAVIGLWRARIVQMTGMPELIAALHSFVGLAAVLVGWASYVEVERKGLGGFTGSLLHIHHAEVFIGIFIGAVTFTGSIVANLKLSARIKSAPLVLPGKNVLNLVALLAFGVLTLLFVIHPALPKCHAGASLAVEQQARRHGLGLDPQVLARLRFRQDCLCGRAAKPPLPRHLRIADTLLHLAIQIGAERKAHLLRRFDETVSQRQDRSVILDT